MFRLRRNAGLTLVLYIWRYDGRTVDIRAIDAWSRASLSDLEKRSTIYLSCYLLNIEIVVNLELAYNINRKPRTNMQAKMYAKMYRHANIA